MFMIFPSRAEAEQRHSEVGGTLDQPLLAPKNWWAVAVKAEPTEIEQ